MNPGAQTRMKTQSLQILGTSSRSMQAQWCRLLSRENALRLEVKLNGLGPPSRLRATRKQIFREVCENRLFKGGNGETR